MNHPPWRTIGLSEELTLTTEWASFDLPFTATEDEAAARIQLAAGSSDASFTLARVALVSEEGAAPAGDELHRPDGRLSEAGASTVAESLSSFLAERGLVP